MNFFYSVGKGMDMVQKHVSSKKVLPAGCYSLSLGRLVNKKNKRWTVSIRLMEKK
jgi:hypothetical protein